MNHKRLKSNIRAVHIGKYYPPFAGGIENFTADLVIGLQNRRVDCAAIVHQHDSAIMKPTTEDGPPLILRAPTHGQLIYAPISPSFPILLHQIIKRFKPDLLHIHMPNTSAFWALFSSKARQIPWVVHWHSDIVTSPSNRNLKAAYLAYRYFETAVLERSQTIIATSKPYLDTSITLRPFLDKCRVIPLGLSEKRIPPPSKPDLDAAEAIWGRRTDLRILSVGRLTYYKGHDVLIHALHQLPRGRAVIVGHGHDYARLKKLVQTHDLSKRVNLIGFVPNSKLYALMATCDLLCLPSIERTEAFGLVLLEAMLFGKPCLATSVSGSRMGFVVKHNETGWLVKPGDAGALADQLRQIMVQPDRLKQMGQNARKRFDQFFSIEPIADQVRRVYDDGAIA
jgi:rhamnosyl/mannosyltransferase